MNHGDAHRSTTDQQMEMIIPSPAPPAGEGGGEGSDADGAVLHAES